MFALWVVGCQASAPPGTSSDGTGQNTAGGNAIVGVGSGGAFAGTSSGGTSAGRGPTQGGGGNGVTGGGSGGTGSQANAGSTSSSSNAGSNGGAMKNPLDVGNYFASGAWMGYVWTSTSAAGSTITPMDFMAQSTGMPRCVKGTVAAAADYSGTAILGVNLSEGMGATSPTVTPTKAGVIIDVANHAGSPLRFQVKSAITGGTEWCVAITGSGGFIPWTSLRTKCWDSSMGVAYNREPIASAMLLVPGTNTAPVMFDFCWNSLVEADAPAGGSAGSGSTGTAGTSSAGSSGSTGSAGMSNTGSGGATGSGGYTGMTVPPLQNGCNGWASRYWDCCKPHCGWSANAPQGTLASCDGNNQTLGNNDVANACQSGNKNDAHLCYNAAPWAVSDRLAYGFAAVPAVASAYVCGKCYQLDFNGSSHNGGADQGSAALAGKTMIVQAINIGGDVRSGQFDLAIPGGGVGQFNGCSQQWGSTDIGSPSGGFLTSCQSNSDFAARKSCVMNYCSKVFEAKGLTDLAEGCRWFVDWYNIADNPSMKYAEVACPSALQDRGIHRSGGGSNTCF